MQRGSVLLERMGSQGLLSLPSADVRSDETPRQTLARAIPRVAAEIVNGDIQLVASFDAPDEMTPDTLVALELWRITVVDGADLPSTEAIEWWDPVQGGFERLHPVLGQRIAPQLRQAGILL